MNDSQRWRGEEDFASCQSLLFHSSRLESKCIDERGPRGRIIRFYVCFTLNAPKLDLKVVQDYVNFTLSLRMLTPTSSPAPKMMTRPPVADVPVDRLLLLCR